MKQKCAVAALLMLGLVTGLRGEPVGWLGIYHETLTQPMLTALGISHGVLVADVVDNSPAAKAGLKVGDTVLEIDSTPVMNIEDLRQRVSKLPGQVVRLLYLRERETKTMSVELGARERQFDLGLEGLAPVRNVIEQVQPMVRSLEEQCLDELRALRAEVGSLEKEIERLRKDLKKLETGKP